MSAPGEWTKLRSISSEHREVIEGPRPLPERVRFLASTTEADLRTSIGCSAVPGVLFVSMALLMAGGWALKDGPSTDPWWLNAIAMGIPAGIGMFLVGQAVYQFRRREELRVGEFRDGIYFFPDAVVLTTEGQACALPCADIIRFTHDRWKERVGEKRRLVAREEVRAHVLLEGEKQLYGLRGGGVENRELLSICRRWHRDAQRRSGGVQGGEVA